MPATQIKAEYEQLGQIAQLFDQHALAMLQVIKNTKQGLDTLEGGDWEGAGARLFYNEMNEQILPSFKRLSHALSQAGRATLQIQAKMLDAEQASAALLLMRHQNDPARNNTTASESGTGATQSQSSGAGVNPSTGASIKLADVATPRTLPDWQQKNRLLARDPNSLFTDDYMHGLVGSQVTGADTKPLQTAMNKLAQNPQGAELDQVLNEVAQARQRPLAQIRDDYQKYLAIREQAHQNHAPADQLNRLHPDFMGSISQMRYGKVVGDAFGVDPVFGAMLNPTGGLVGPDNWAIDAGHAGGKAVSETFGMLSDGITSVYGGKVAKVAVTVVGKPLSLILNSEAVSYHGVVHDAAGYLYNYHQTGPGYNYLGLENRNTSSPLTGQREGLRYWADKTPGAENQMGGKIAEYVMRGTVFTIDGVSMGVDAVKQGWGKMADLF